MQLEFHHLERCWEHLRVRHPARQRHLLASLAECGQQTPIVAVAAEEQADRYVVIDGYKENRTPSTWMILLVLGTINLTRLFSVDESRSESRSQCRPQFRSQPGSP